MSFYIQSHTQEQSNALAVELLNSYQQYIRTRETAYNGMGSLDQTLGVAMGMREGCILTLFGGTDLGYLPDLVHDYKTRMSTLGVGGHEMYKALSNPLDLNGLTEAEKTLVEGIERYRQLYRQLIKGPEDSGNDVSGAHVITLHQARGMKDALDVIKNTKEAQKISYILQARLY